ncbi:beta-ketoacyl-ACP synthase III [Adhaeretor mobilis]|uniref:Beta-ketoacyl-[acyl-carrier-protein] synthase III n=1 Tax=Adhaeretor mobilis TaxID=1930276 RepID=A0A517N1H8_9BACT|nr:beta-ketoacyl-ACP synthase III [Adhaeretor mobilis]QDT00990.1 3-oxoacyl-[acyl-carrier-protein] synthase 3 [Adhaeretor mobilis]
MSDETPSIGGAPLRSLTGVRIVGTGSYVPDNIVTNDDLARLGCDADWIIQRTGIRERRHAPPGMSTGDMAYEAAKKCLDAAGVSASEVDLLTLATFTPDRLAPATATTVQDRLGLSCAAMDISAACAGFTYALCTAMQFVATGCSKYALVIGADTNSRIVDPNDVKIYPIFGDGAGAVLLTKGSDEQGALSYTLGADGSGTELLYRPEGGSLQPCAIGAPPTNDYYLQMNGRPVFKWAVRLVEENVQQVLDHAGLASTDIACYLFHQANARILDAAVSSLGIDRERVVKHIDRYGNTSAASIPLALDETYRAGGVKSGDHLLMSGFGAGLAWGTIAWRW